MNYGFSENSFSARRSFFQNGTNRIIPVSIAQQSAIGVAQAMPFTPASAFIRNIKGTSRPPLRSMERISAIKYSMEYFTLALIYNDT